MKVVATWLCWSVVVAAGCGSVQPSEDSEGSGSADSTGTATGAEDTSASGSIGTVSSGLDSGDSGGPNECADGGCAIECTPGSCLPLDRFGPDGCARSSCARDSECGAGQRCYVGELFGECVGSSLFCEWNEERMQCSCGGTDDCGGGYCVDSGSFPMAEEGPLLPARIENGCAPDDGGTKDFLFGLAEPSCDAMLSADSPSLLLSMTGLPITMTGTFEIGLKYTPSAGQGWYSDGAGATESVWFGTVTIDAWDPAAGVSGRYEVWVGEGDEGGYRHLAAEFANVEDCGGMPGCG